MKIEIEKSEYDRLKSREEKLMAYYEWFVDKENDLVTVEDIINKNTELEEENEKLKEENEKLEEENINLISFNEHYSPDVIVKYEDRYETLYHEVDIECAKLSDENKKLNIKVASLEGEIKGLNYTIEKLHKELDECECSFGFESDEVGYRKREYKRLKKWIKDHCKGYGNLFPEDEMKRQWKKADKKRKKTKEDDELIYEEGLYD